MMTQDERTAWLAERRTGIGATDLASVLGVGFRTAAEVYADKCGDGPRDREPTPLMALGLAMEPHNAALYGLRTGAHLVSPGLVRVPDEPWAFATLDRVRLDHPRECNGRPVELKYTTFFDAEKWGPDGSDRVSDGYIVQAVWQAAVLRSRGHEVPGTDISALAGTGEHRIYHIPFDPALAQLLFEVGRSFWGRVEARAGVADWEPPLALVDAIANRLVAVRPDTTVDLDYDALELADVYEQWRATEKGAKEQADAIKSQLVKLLGGAETGVLPDGRRVQQKLTHRAAYTVEATSYPRFSILKAKKGKLS